MYTTELLQCYIHTQVLGHHLPSVWAWSSVSLMGSNSSSDENVEWTVRQVKMIIKALIVINYKHPPIGLWILYQTIQAPFCNYNVLLLQLLLLSFHGISSSKQADSASSCTQVYPCNCCPDLCSSSLVRKSWIDYLQISSYV